MNPALAELVRLLAAAAVDDYIAKQAQSPKQQAPAPAPQGVAVRVKQKDLSNEES